MGADIGAAIMDAAGPSAPAPTFKAGTPGYSVMGDLGPKPVMPIGVRPEAVARVREQLLRSTPQQRVTLAGQSSLEGRIANTLLQTETAALAPRESVIQNTPLPTRIGMDIGRVVTNPAARGVVSGLAGIGQIVPGIVQAGADLVGADDVSRFAAGAAGAARQVADPLRPAGGTDRLVFDVFNSATQSAPTILTGLMGGPAMTVLFGQSAAQNYSEGRSRGLSGDDAAARAGIMAGAEVLGERFGFGEQIKLLRGITGGLPVEELAPLFAREVVKNATGEQLTTLTQFLADKYGPGALNPEGTLAQYLTQAGDTLKTSLGQSALMAGGPAVIQKARDTMRRQEDMQTAGAPDLAQPAQAANPFDQFDQAPAAGEPDSMGRIEPTLNMPPVEQPAVQPQPQGAPDELRQEGQETAQAVTEPAPAAAPPASAPNSQYTIADTPPELVAIRRQEVELQQQLSAANEEKDRAVDSGDQEAISKAFDRIDAIRAEMAALQQSYVDTSRRLREERATGATDTQRVSTVTGRQIDTRLRVVDASELQAASGELQPRDRSRASSDEQINQIAATLDPQRLGASAEADRGAPIIGPDMIVESGNGRVQGIRRAAGARARHRVHAGRPDCLRARGQPGGDDGPVAGRARQDRCVCAG